MNILYPRIRPALLPAMLGHAVLGGLMAGCYGILHDQITYSISQEYFTRLKFQQFHYADFGLPPRVFVAEIGFLATWWVGFLAAWFLARITIPTLPRATALRHSLRGFFMIFAFAVVAAIMGFIFGLLHGPDYSAWEDLATSLQIRDLRNFVRVAYIHNAGYLGSLIGLITAVIHVKRVEKTWQLGSAIQSSRHHAMPCHRRPNL